MLTMKRRLEKSHTNGTTKLLVWEVDLPYDGRLTWREGTSGQPPQETSRQCGSLQEACEQLNALFAEKFADGYGDAPPPTWHEGLSAPEGPYEECVEYYEDNPSQPEHRYFKRTDGSDREDGPEWRYHDNGTPSFINIQQDTKAEGVRLAYRPSGQLHALVELQRDQHHGFYYIFGENGLISMLLLHQHDQKIWSCDFHESGTIHTLCGPKQDDEFHGYWAFRDEDGGLQSEKWFERGTCVRTHDYEGGQLTYAKDAEDIEDLSKGYTSQLDLTEEHPVLSIFYQGNIIRQQTHSNGGTLLRDVLAMHNDDGEEIDRWYHFYNEDGTLDRLVRQQNKKYAEILRFHPDGSVEEWVSERGEQITKEVNTFHPSGRFDQRQVYLKGDRREVYDFTEEGRLTNIVQSDTYEIWDGVDIKYDDNFHIKSWEQWREGEHLTTHSDITMPSAPPADSTPPLDAFLPPPVPSYVASQPSTQASKEPVARSAKDPKARM